MQASRLGSARALAAGLCLLFHGCQSSAGAAEPAVTAGVGPTAVPVADSVPALSDDFETGFRALAPGVEYRVFADFGDSPTGDRKLHVVRVDPARASLRPWLASEGDRRARSAGEWCDREQLVVAINAGMF